MQNGLWRKELALIIIGFFLAMSFNLPVSGNEIIDNHPPIITSFMWVTNGYVGESYKLILNATDPDGDDVYFFINWADGSDSGWVGPYKSGEAVDVYHAWENIGTYYFRFKAKDIYGAESNWSELYSVSITITAHVKIRIHRGFGVGVTVTIKNLGVKDFENIPWYCYFYRQKRSPPPWPEIQEKQGDSNESKSW